MKKLLQGSLVLLFVCACIACDNASQPSGFVLAPSAPKDQPVSLDDRSKADELKAAIAPLIERARQTYPDAKSRYLAGLPAGHVFFVVVTLRDGDGAEEQVFLAVSRIQEGRITGRIANNLIGVRTYRQGDTYTFPEEELIDWLISRPDGSEEGNIVGKFLDEWQKSKAVSAPGGAR